MSPLGADPRNLAFFPEEGPLADYCNGDRMKRIHAALPPGSVALTCTLFFDEINRDQKGFNTGDGGIVVGGFFRSHVRESTDAKVSFCTFPKVTFGHKNRGLKRVGVFLKKLRHHQLEAIYGCFTRFYHSVGGRGATAGTTTIPILSNFTFSCTSKRAFIASLQNSTLKCYFQMSV
jgi:hypothetical protein